MFVKGNGFLFYAKNMGKNIRNIISKNLSRKDSHNLLDRAKKSAADTFKASSKKAIQKIAEETGDLIGNKITKISKTSQQNNSDTVTNQNYKEITEEVHIPTKEREKIMENMKLI